MFKLTQEEANKALDSGEVKALSSRGTWLSCRRNGKTKTWVTRPNDFRIPVSIGFRSHGYITHDTSHGYITHDTLFCQPGDGPKAEFLYNSMCKPASASASFRAEGASGGEGT